MGLTYSDVESRRFGMRVFRARLESFDVDRLRTAIFDARADLVICRAPLQLLPELSGLQLLGMPVVVADTLVHYYRDLTSPRPPPPDAIDIDCVEAGAAAAGEVADLVRTVFAGYLNHYAANPLLERGAVLEGYVEWALAHLAAAPERRVWLALREGAPIALATCQYGEEAAEGVLFGVLPEAMGAGVYRNLIRFTVADAAARGLRIMETSTQVHNFAVQKVWSSEGFVLRRAEVTFHVNALLTLSDPEAVAAEATVGAAGLAALADRHLRGAVTMKLPGSAPSGARVGWTNPRPLREGAPCRLRIGFPGGRRAFPAVCLQATDGDGNLMVLGYHHVADGAPGE